MKSLCEIQQLVPNFKSFQAVITYGQLLDLAKKRNHSNYWYAIKQYKHCFTGDFVVDINHANQIISSVVNNNTAHSICSVFRWSYDLFYGILFNHKYLLQRTASYSKFTSRLDIKQIRLILSKLIDYINASDTINNNWWQKQNTKISRMKLLHTFQILLCTGIRLGEFSSIDFQNQTIKREIKSNFSNETFYEIVINTEKTNKNREIFIPKQSFEFLRSCPNNKYSTIGYDFRTFSTWANLSFKLTPHVCRRTLASIMHEGGVDVDTIAMVLGNTPTVVRNHYILSSQRNYDACELASALINGSIAKSNNSYLNTNWMKLIPRKN